MRGTILLLAAVLAGCAASNPANSPIAPPQAAAWRHRDGTAVSPAEFAGISQACQQQAAAEGRSIPRSPATLESTHSEDWAQGVPPAPSQGVAVPSITGNTMPSAPLPPPRSRLIDQCLEDAGLMPAN
jgi:hypothetical protein